jgi:hypothetical protein
MPIYQYVIASRKPKSDRLLEAASLPAKFGHSLLRLKFDPFCLYFPAIHSQRIPHLTCIIHEKRLYKGLTEWYYAIVICTQCNTEEAFV